MPAPQISPLPTPPSRSQSPETFSVDADAFLGAFPDFQAEANDQADYLDALAIDVDEASAAAVAAAAIAAGAANYQGDYNAGTTYQIGESVSYTGRRYVAKTVNTGVTPADGANWFLINDGDVLGPVSATNNGIALYDGTTGKIIKNGPAAGTAGNILVSNGTTWASQAPPAVSGSVTATATGSIGNGQFVVLNTDGTVSIVSGMRPSQGAQATVTNATANSRVAADYDSINQRILVAYLSNNSDVRLRVGTVTNNTISFGAETTLSTSGTSNFICVHFNVTAGCFFVAFYDLSYQQGRGATVRLSGDTISAGSLSAFSGNDSAGIAITTVQGTANIIIFSTVPGFGYGISAWRYQLPTTGTGFPTQLNSFGQIGITTNSSAGQLISASTVGGTGGYDGAIAWIDASNNANVRLFYVSGGSSLAFNTSVQYAGGNYRLGTCMLWLPSVSRLLVGTRDTVATYNVSGGTFTLVQAIAIDPAGALYPSVALDTAANRVLITYYNSDGYRTRNTLAFTATTLARETAVVISAVATNEYNATVYNANTQSVVAFYGNKANVINSSLSTNLTAFNMIGAANGAYTNGQAATIQTIGAVNTAQTGLTPASPSYIWADGTLNSIADPLMTFSVLAGTALTTTSIIVKA